MLLCGNAEQQGKMVEPRMTLMTRIRGRKQSKNWRVWNQYSFLSYPRPSATSAVNVFSVAGGARAAPFRGEQSGPGVSPFLRARAFPPLRGSPVRSSSGKCDGGHPTLRNDADFHVTVCWVALSAEGGAPREGERGWDADGGTGWETRGT
jgi:hypothetical protein